MMGLSGGQGRKGSFHLDAIVRKTILMQAREVGAGQLLHSISGCKRRLTHHVVVIEAQLAGLAGLEDLHPDELDLRLAVLKHLLCGR